MNKMRLLLHLRWLALYLFLLGLLLTPHSLQAQGALDDQAPDDTEAIHNLYLPMITHHFVQAPTLETNTEKDQSNLLADIPIERQAQVDAQATGATAASNEIYLPIIGNLFGQSPRVGIHLGNRNSDWPSTLLVPIDQSGNGKIPAIVVVRSDQLFEITRVHPDNGGDCSINGVSALSIKSPTIYAYLKQISTQAKVIIRIEPSPGNFEESISVANWWDLVERPSPRTLQSAAGYRPGGWLLCDNAWRFRPTDDLGDEIVFIQQYALNDGWEIFGFEPANEPNIEWYGQLVPLQKVPEPNNLDEEAWQAMDAYFANVYDHVHAKAETLGIQAPRVFTPPMAQSAMAEELHVLNKDSQCQNNRFSGYALMDQVFTPQYFWQAAKNDGYSWHNYWVQGMEDWGECPNGQHVSFYFPDDMKRRIIWTRPSIISEFDLAPPAFGWGNAINDKDADPAATAASIDRFLEQEQNGLAWLGTRSQERWYAAWLLNDDFDGSGTDSKHIWVMAYDATKGGFRAWFNQWWTGEE